MRKHINVSFITFRDTTARTLNFYNFSDDEISSTAAPEQSKMTEANYGLREYDALAAFSQLKYQLSDYLIDKEFAKLSEEDKPRLESMSQQMKSIDIFTRDGRSFTQEHINLLRLGPSINRRGR